MSRDTILELVDNVKEKITSSEYKSLVEEIAKITKDISYILSIMYIEYNTSVNEDQGVTEYNNSVLEYKLRLQRSELRPHEEEFDRNYPIEDRYRPANLRSLINMLPKLYEYQLYHIMSPEGTYTLDNNEDPVSLHRTSNILYKLTVC